MAACGRTKHPKPPSRWLSGAQFMPCVAWEQQHGPGGLCLAQAVRGPHKAVRKADCACGPEDGQ